MARFSFLSFWVVFYPFILISCLNLIFQNDYYLYYDLIKIIIVLFVLLEGHTQKCSRINSVLDQRTYVVPGVEHVSTI